MLGEWWPSRIGARSETPESFGYGTPLDKVCNLATISLQIAEQAQDFVEPAPPRPSPGGEGALRNMVQLQKPVGLQCEQQWERAFADRRPERAPYTSIG